MKITKYQHACMIVEKGNNKLVIDPGNYSELPGEINNVSVIVVTHIHDDHLGKENITKIVDVNPGVTIVADSEVMAELAMVNCAKLEITENCIKQVGGFELELLVGDHAVIYNTVPCQNLRVVVNDMLYYPGDSLIPLDRKVVAVAVPLAAPWSKVGEVVDFAKNSQADVLFAVHDAVLSKLGLGFYNSSVSRYSETPGRQYKAIEVGESIDI